MNKFAVLAAVSVASFIPMIVIGAVNGSWEPQKKLTPAHTQRDTVVAPKARETPKKAEETRITVDPVSIVVPRQAPKPVRAPCQDGQTWRVGAMKATPDGAVGNSMVTLRCR